MPTSEEIMHVSIGRNYACLYRGNYVFLYQKKLCMSVSGGIPSPAKPPPAKLVFFPSPGLASFWPCKVSPPTLQIDINQSYIVYINVRAYISL